MSRARVVTRAVALALVGCLAFGAPSVALAAGSAKHRKTSTATSTTGAASSGAASSGAASSGAASSGAAGAAGAAAAGGVTTNPLSGFPTPPVATSSTPAATVSNASTSGSGASSFSGSNAIAIALGAVVIIAGISFFIWRDARRRAPVRASGGGALPGDGRRSGSKAPPKQRKLSPAERRRRKRGRAR